MRSRLTRFFSALRWRPVAPLKREDGNLLIVEWDRLTGDYRVTINERIGGEL